MNRAFGTDFTVGVEEEMHLVDPDTHQLTPAAVAVLADMEEHGHDVGHEAYAAQIELRTGPHADAEGVRAGLGAARAWARESGATLMGAGLHPTDTWGNTHVVDEPRYRVVAESMRDIFGRTPEAALHVHVGMPDAETAIGVFNGMRRHLPLLIGLAANSPWWFNHDSGFASSRWALVRSYPGRGIPPVFESWDHYVAHHDEVAAAGGPSDYTLVWWDIRPHPRLGTVEVRELDAQSTLADAAAIAALVQALARREAEAPAAELPSAEAIAWSCFRAARDGLDAEVLHDDRLLPVREVARHAGAALGVEEIEELLARGGGAARRRAAVDRGGPAEMLRELVAETRG